MNCYKIFNLILVTLLLFTACNADKKKDDVIKEEKFVEVLTDIHMADATLFVKGFRVRKDSVRIRKYYNDILLEYNITQKQLHNTFSYYTQNPREFEKVYEEVSANIARLEKDHLEKKEDNSKNNNDKVKIKKKIANQKGS